MDPRHTHTPDPDPVATIRAVRITPDGDLEVVHIPARYDALADAVGAPHRVGDIGIVSAGTWQMRGCGYMTLWTVGTPGGDRNPLAERVADRIVTRAEWGIDVVRDRISKGSLAGTVVLAAYDRSTGAPADLGDVAVERVRVVADGRLDARQAAAARDAPTGAILAADVTAALDVPAPGSEPIGGVADLMRRIAIAAAPGNGKARRRPIINGRMETP